MSQIVRVQKAALSLAAYVGTLTVPTPTDHAQQASQPTPQAANPINHIIFLAQENRSFDHYFGALRHYWAHNGYPDQSFDGLPQFNPKSGIPPLYGPPPTNPGCDSAFPPPSDCTIDSNSPNVRSFKVLTQCTENTSP